MESTVVSAQSFGGSCRHDVQTLNPPGVTWSGVVLWLVPSRARVMRCLGIPIPPSFLRSEPAPRSYVTAGRRLTGRPFSVFTAAAYEGSPVFPLGDLQEP